MSCCHITKILWENQAVNVFNNVILARNIQLPDDDRMIETCRSIFKTFNVNNLSVCIGWCTDQVMQNKIPRTPSFIILYHFNTKQLKCTLVQALRLYTGRTAHRGSRGIALLFHDHDTRRRWGVSVTPRPLFTPGKDQVPIVQEAGWAQRSVWTGAENLAPTGLDPRTVQPVSNRCSDWATPAHTISTQGSKIQELF